MKNIIRIIIAFFLLTFPLLQSSQNGVDAFPAYCMDDSADNIPVDGRWPEGNRSLSGEIPITVSWDGTYLYIETTSGRSEIHVSISNGYEAVIPAGTLSSVLYVGALNVPCELVLTNQFGDRLVGEIE